MIQVKDFFGYKTLGDFAKDWKALSDTDKEQLKQGVTDGTLNY